jgi:CheY-like chemotaxis protein
MTHGALVLVVDDDELLQELVKIALEGEGFAVAQALTGAEMRTQLARARPDLIVLDVALPDADGRDLLAELKKDPQDCPHRSCCGPGAIPIRIAPLRSTWAPKISSKRDRPTIW